VLLVRIVYRVKMAESIEMSFGLYRLTWVQGTMIVVGRKLVLGHAGLEHGHVPEPAFCLLLMMYSVSGDPHNGVV